VRSYTHDSCSYDIYGQGCLAALLSGLDATKPQVTAALIAAAGALLLAILRALTWIINAPRDRRRDLYGRAYQDAMAWLEMLYRIRRRGNDDSSDRELVERFHSAQERIDHHRGWLGSESRYLARSYCRLVRAIKHETEPLIQAAWQQPGRPPGQPTSDDERHPMIEQYSLDFLTDVRLHLSLWPVFPAIRLAWRNRGEDNNPTKALPNSKGDAPKEASRE
jgi:hypothetical protein